MAGIVGRADVGAAIFFLLALLSYRRYAQLRSRLSHVTRLKSWPAAAAAAATIYAANNNGNVAPLAAASSPPCRSLLTQAIGKWAASSASTAPTLLTLRKWLWMATTLLMAACSMLTKEHGVTVLAVCAVYDVVVHSRVKPRHLLSALWQVNGTLYYFIHFDSIQFNSIQFDSIQFNCN